jgi:hypothetical protein
MYLKIKMETSDAANLESCLTEMKALILLGQTTDSTLIKRCVKYRLKILSGIPKNNPFGIPQTDRIISNYQ